MLRNTLYDERNGFMASNAAVQAGPPDETLHCKSWLAYSAQLSLIKSGGSFMCWSVLLARGSSNGGMLDFMRCELS